MKAYVENVFGKCAAATKGASKRLWAWFIAPGLLVLIALGGAPAQAQEVSCASAIAEARSQYQNRNFDVAIRQLYECLIEEDVRRGDIVEGYRLLALAYLRRGDQESAEQAVERLLDSVPGYAPDSVQDPPPYLALVQRVKERPGASAEPMTRMPAEVDTMTSGVPSERDTVANRDTPRDALATEDSLAEERAPATEPGARTPASTRRWSLAIGLGVTHYGGDRGRPGENALDELTNAPGFAARLEATYRFSSYFGGGLYYAAGSFPDLLNEEGFVDETINEATSSIWIHEVGVFGVVRLLPPVAPVVPYIRAGVVGAFTRKNDALRTGVGPHVGAGVRIPVHGPVSLFTEVSGDAIFPGDAVDLVDRSSSYDWVVWVTAGLRYRF